MFHQVFICDTLQEENSLSEVKQTADDNGLTEPDDFEEKCETPNITTLEQTLNQDLFSEEHKSQTKLSHSLDLPLHDEKFETPNTATLEQTLNQDPFSEEHNSQTKLSYSLELALNAEKVENVQVKDENMELGVPSAREIVEQTVKKIPFPEENVAQSEKCHSLEVPMDDQMVENVQCKDVKMELDIPHATVITEQTLEKIQFPEENVTQSEICDSLEVPTDDQKVENVQVKSEKMDLDDPLNTADLEHALKQESLPEDRKAPPDISYDLLQPLDNEALKRTCNTTSPEECFNLKICSNKQQLINVNNKNDNYKTNSSELCDNSKGPYLNKINCEEILMSNPVGEHAIDQGLGDNNTLSHEDEMSIGVDSDTNQDQKCQNDREETFKSTSAVNTKNKNSIESPSSSCINNSFVKLASKQITKQGHIDQKTIISENRKRHLTFSESINEEDSGSDWEQEYFGSSDVYMKGNFSDKSSNQTVHVNKSQNIQRQVLDSNNVINLYPVKVLKVVIQRLPDTNITLNNNASASLKDEMNVVLSKNSINTEKVITNKKNSTVELSETMNNYIKKIITDSSKKKCNITPYICFDCNKYFSDKYCLKKHNKLKHPGKVIIEVKEISANKKAKSETCDGEKPIICNVCHKTFKTKTQMSNHTRTLCFGYKKALRFQCDVCGKCFSGERKMLDHKNTHTNAKPYKCTECDKCFNGKVNRSIHYKKIHQNVKEKTLMCSFCGITSKSISHMLAHEEIHRLPEGAEIPTPFKCLECGRGYISKYSLKNHTKLHYQKKKCPHCSAQFKTRHQLRVHLRDIHNIIKSYNCKLCERTYENPSSFKAHVRTHSGFKFFCEICDKGFNTKGNIQQHMITHSDERPLSCPDCGDRFKRITHLNQHLSAIHGRKRRE